MADIWSKQSEVMSKIKSKNTRPELLLRKTVFTNKISPDDRYKVIWNQNKAMWDLLQY